MGPTYSGLPSPCLTHTGCERPMGAPQLSTRPHPDRVAALALAAPTHAHPHAVGCGGDHGAPSHAPAHGPCYPPAVHIPYTCACLCRHGSHPALSPYPKHVGPGLTAAHQQPPHAQRHGLLGTARDITSHTTLKDAAAKVRPLDVRCRRHPAAPACRTRTLLAAPRTGSSPPAAAHRTGNRPEAAGARNRRQQHPLDTLAAVAAQGLHRTGMGMGTGSPLQAAGLQLAAAGVVAGVVAVAAAAACAAGPGASSTWLSWPPT